MALSTKIAREKHVFNKQIEIIDFKLQINNTSV